MFPHSCLPWEKSGQSFRPISRALDPQGVGAAHWVGLLGPRRKLLWFRHGESWSMRVELRVDVQVVGSAWVANNIARNAER